MWEVYYGFYVITSSTCCVAGMYAVCVVLVDAVEVGDDASNEEIAGLN